MPAPGEGSSQKEKEVARPWSMRDLYWVKAWVPDEPCIAREILEGVQRGEAKALEKVKALEKEIHGLKADLKAVEMKN
ncbi:hypothetical protein GW17_00008715 [Ensete ventricosum]|nr:hypothetical protein GW17_00008715 [Ensete ventricosum]